MKRIVGLLVFIFFLGSAIAQNISQSNIPAVVLNAFQLKFPNADDIKWKLDEGIYRVDYRVNNKVHKLTMDYKGNVLKQFQDLYSSEIPKSVLKTIESKVAYFDVDDADRYEEGNNVVYEIQFKINGKSHYFRVNEKGKLLKYRKELAESEIPLSIRSLIHDQYGSLDIDRSKYVEEGGKKTYIIRGEIDHSDHAFLIDNNTTVLKHTQDIKNTEIPKPILKSKNAVYKDYDIRDADLTEEEGKAIYILRMRKSKENIYVTFNPEGKILHVK